MKAGGMQTRFEWQKTVMAHWWAVHQQRAACTACIHCLSQPANPTACGPFLRQVPTAQTVHSTLRRYVHGTPRDTMPTVKPHWMSWVNGSAGRRRVHSGRPLYCTGNDKNIELGNTGQVWQGDQLYHNHMTLSCSVRQNCIPVLTLTIMPMPRS